MRSDKDKLEIELRKMITTFSVIGDADIEGGIISEDERVACEKRINARIKYLIQRICQMLETEEADYKNDFTSDSEKQWELQEYGKYRFNTEMGHVFLDLFFSDCVTPEWRLYSRFVRLWVMYGSVCDPSIPIEDRNIEHMYMPFDDNRRFNARIRCTSTHESISKTCTGIPREYTSSYVLGMPAWSVWECLCVLSIFKHDVYILGKKTGQTHDFSDTESLNHLRDFLIRSIGIGELHTHKDVFGKVFIKPRDLIVWAKNIGLNVPDFFEHYLKDDYKITFQNPRKRTPRIDEPNERREIAEEFYRLVKDDKLPVKTALSKISNRHNIQKTTINKIRKEYKSEFPYPCKMK